MPELTAESAEVLELHERGVCMKQTGSCAACTHTNTHTTREMGLQAFPTPDHFHHNGRFKKKMNIRRRPS